MAGVDGRGMVGPGADGLGFAGEVWVEWTGEDRIGRHGRAGYGVDGSGGAGEVWCGEDGNGGARTGAGRLSVVVDLYG